MEGYDSNPKKRVLWEVLLVFGLATLLCAMFWHLRRLVPFINRNLHALVAAVFLYLPTGLIMKRKEDFATYGLSFRPLGRGLWVFFAVSLVVFPLFTVGFYAYYKVLCSRAGAVTVLPAQLGALCRRFKGGWPPTQWGLPKDFAQIALAQLLVVALPEEYFFRGYVQSRLEVIWPSQRHLFGQLTGLSLVATSILFALGHVLVDFNALRLAVFFPALVFGWMRQATGSILASVLFHACSNLLSELLHSFFF